MHHAQKAGRADYKDHSGHVEKFRTLFFIMLLIVVSVIGFSETFSMLLGYSLPEQNIVGFVSPVLSTVVFSWGGWPLLDGSS